jgi:hypothetical protein
MEPQRFNADTLLEAFAKVTFISGKFIEFPKHKEGPTFYWDDDVPFGTLLDNCLVMTKTTRDVPISRASWTFSDRQVKFVRFPKEASP